MSVARGASEIINLRHGDARAELDASMGNLGLWQVGGRRPLDTAPWRDAAEAQADPDLAPVIKRLGGDMFCMPYGSDDGTGTPRHGPAANAPWQVIRSEGAHALLTTTLPGFGDARVTKDITLQDSALLQRHRIEGGAGEITFAHRPMTRMAEGGRLSFSRKRAAMTDPTPRHEAQNYFCPSQMRGDLYLELESGGQWDGQSYPAGQPVDDICTLVEARENTLGWTCLMRHAEDDLLLILKDPAAMPVTLLWFSNGAFDDAPQRPRHSGVLGILDGCALGAQGLTAARAENGLRQMEVPTTISLGRLHHIRHAMISLPRPPGWSGLQSVHVRGATLTLREAAGAEMTVPFPKGFFDA